MRRQQKCSASNERVSGAASAPSTPKWAPDGGGAPQEDPKVPKGHPQLPTFDSNDADMSPTSCAFQMPPPRYSDRATMVATATATTMTATEPAVLQPPAQGLFSSSQRVANASSASVSGSSFPASVGRPTNLPWVLQSDGSVNYFKKFESHACTESDPNSILMSTTSSVMSGITLSEASSTPANVLDQTSAPFAPPTSPASTLTTLPMCKKKFHRAGTSPIIASSSASPPKSSIVELFCIASLTSARSCEDHCVCGDCTGLDIPPDNSLNRIRSHYMIDTSKYNIPEETESQVLVTGSSLKTSHLPAPANTAENPAVNTALQETEEGGLSTKSSDCNTLVKNQPVLLPESGARESKGDKDLISSVPTSERFSAPHKSDSSSDVHPGPTTKPVQTRGSLTQEFDHGSESALNDTDTKVHQTHVRSPISKFNDHESVPRKYKTVFHQEVPKSENIVQPMPTLETVSHTFLQTRSTSHSSQFIPNKIDDLDFTQDSPRTINWSLFSHSISSIPDSKNQAVPNHLDKEFLSKSDEVISTVLQKESCASGKTTLISPVDQMKQSQSFNSPSLIPNSSQIFITGRSDGQSHSVYTETKVSPQISVEENEISKISQEGVKSVLNKFDAEAEVVLNIPEESRSLSEHSYDSLSMSDKSAAQPFSSTLC